MYTIRQAELTDLDTIVGFTLDEAREAEGLDIDAAVSRDRLN
jgi:hypothetical protein